MTLTPIDDTIAFSMIKPTTPPNWVYDQNTQTWTWQAKKENIAADEGLWVYDIKGTGYYFQVDSEPGCKLSYQIMNNSNVVRVVGNISNTGISG